MHLDGIRFDIAPYLLRTYYHSVGIEAALPHLVAIDMTTTEGILCVSRISVVSPQASHDISKVAYKSLYTQKQSIGCPTD